MATEVRFRYISKDDAFVTDKASKYSGAFMKIASDVVSVQPNKRRLLFPHIESPDTDNCALAITPSGVDTSMGEFSWEKYSSYIFTPSKEHTFITDSLDAPWHPTGEGCYAVHANLYDIEDLPHGNVINGFSIDNNWVIPTSSTTIVPSESEMRHITDAPAIFEENDRVCITPPSGPLDKIGRAYDVPHGTSSMSLLSRSILDVPTNTSIWSNLQDEAYYVGDGIALIGYMNSGVPMIDHIDYDGSVLKFIDINIMRSRIFNDSASQLSSVLSSCVPTEVDKVDSSHAELIDGMWC